MKPSGIARRKQDISNYCGGAVTQSQAFVAMTTSNLNDRHHVRTALVGLPIVSYVDGPFGWHVMPRAGHWLARKGGRP